MKTVDDFKAPKTGVKRYEKMHIIGVVADVINQSLEPFLARLHGTWRRTRTFSSCIRSRHL